MHLMSAIIIGFLMVESFLPDELRLPDDEAVEVMTDALIRALAPRAAAAPVQEPEEVVQAVDRYFAYEVDLIKKQEEKELKS